MGVSRAPASVVVVVVNGWAPAAEQIASNNLNAMHQPEHDPLPWHLSFSYGKALQKTCIVTWCVSLPYDDCYAHPLFFLFSLSVFFLAPSFPPSRFISPPPPTHPPLHNNPTTTKTTT
jgi:hypothetical protein